MSHQTSDPLHSRLSHDVFLFGWRLNKNHHSPFEICEEGCHICNELGEAGVGWIPTRPTTAYQIFPKNNRHTPVMVYNDLMIRNNTVSYYNTNWSRPVTVRCTNTGVGAPVDRRRLTGMICHSFSFRTPPPPLKK